MTGLNIAGNILVEQSYKEDGIFFIIFAVCLLWFVIKEKSGKYVLAIWLSLWFIVQFFSHWFITIVGPWEVKNAYFVDAIKLIPTTEVYVADLYHIVLHMLIAVSLFITIKYIRDTRRGERAHVK